MKIKSYLQEYSIDYVPDFSFLNQLGEMTGKLIVIDKNVFSLYQNVFNKVFDESCTIIIEAVEDTKTIKTALALCQKATQIDAKRNLKIIAIGGGIIQDIACFAANILYRGVGLILVPTTLLAQGDSCIGSKSSLNYLGYKNLLGTIYPPEKVFVCSGFLSTLSQLDYFSGLGEIVRFIIMDSLDNMPKIINNLDRLLSRDIGVVQQYIRLAHIYKKKMVEIDEFDLNQRKILNYGHTFGHAFEAISNYSIPHGLAILLGIIAENKIAVDRGILEYSTAKEIEDICIKLYIAEALRIDNVEQLIDLLAKDKKREGKGIATVLMSSGGKFQVVQDVTTKEVHASTKYLMNLLFSKSAQDFGG